MVKARLRYATAGIRRTKMPASIAHMLIVHKGLKQLQESKASFAKKLDDRNLKTTREI